MGEFFFFNSLPSLHSDFLLQQGGSTRSCPIGPVASVSQICAGAGTDLFDGHLATTRSVELSIPARPHATSCDRTLAFPNFHVQSNRTCPSIRTLKNNFVFFQLLLFAGGSLSAFLLVSNTSSFNSVVKAKCPRHVGFIDGRRRTRRSHRAS
jgi:hypothetical protein